MCNNDLDNLFNTPPIVTYSEIVNEVDSGNYEWNSGAKRHNDVDDFTMDKDTEGLYLDLSPRYDQGIEFDEPINSPTPISYLPSTITIKKDFWKDSEQRYFMERDKQRLYQPK